LLAAEIATAEPGRLSASDSAGHSDGDITVMDELVGHAGNAR
jgi:hypothetical protein